jgi:hypothetical protein
MKDRRAGNRQAALLDSLGICPYASRGFPSPGAKPSETVAKLRLTAELFVGLRLEVLEI